MSAAGRKRARRRLFWAAALGGLGAVVWLAWRFGRPHPGPRMRMEDVVDDLSAGFSRAAVELEDKRHPVHTASLRLHPNYWLKFAAGPRWAIVAPPPAVLRFRVRVPSSGALRFGIGVQINPKGAPRSRGVRFEVAVDGRVLFVRTLDPDHHAHHRRWCDERVELGDYGGREVEIELRTRRASARGPAPGPAAWSHVRLVAEHWRARTVASREHPNLLLVVVDTMRRDALGCYGRRPSPTPNLDRLASRALVLDELVSQASWTLPSVTTLLTGLPPPVHGVVGGERSFLADRVRTLAEHLQASGFTTVAVTANPLVSPATNLDQGFETFIELPWQWRQRNWAGARKVNEEFFAWLARYRHYRFFAYLHYMDPHDPYTPPAALRPQPPPGERQDIAGGWVNEVSRADHPEALLRPADVSYIQRLYLAEVRAWDEAFAAVLERLSALALGDRTLIVVTADHGEEFLEHGHLKHGYDVYDELIRVPLIIAGPGVRPGRVARQAQSADLYYTLCRLLGVAPPPGLYGNDLRAPAGGRFAFSETRVGRRDGRGDLLVAAVRTERWKLIVTPALGLTELYDLASDPGEHHNLAGDSSASKRAGAAAMRASLERWLAKKPTGALAGHVPNPAVEERLRALGYVD